MEPLISRPAPSCTTCSKQAAFQTITMHIGVVSEDVSEIKSTIKEMTTILNKVVLMEERIIQSNQATERAFKAIEKIENRVSSLEQQAPLIKQTNGWVEKALTSGFGIAVLLLLAKLGFKQ